jgi:hypothetical protein
VEPLVVRADLVVVDVVVVEAVDMQVLVVAMAKVAGIRQVAMAVAKATEAVAMTMVATHLDLLQVDTDSQTHTASHMEDKEAMTIPAGMVAAPSRGR